MMRRLLLVLPTIHFLRHGVVLLLGVLGGRGAGVRGCEGTAAGFAVGGYAATCCFGGEGVVAAKV